MNHQRLFFILTSLILISDLIFVGINYHSSQHALQLSLSRNGNNLKHQYDLALSLVYENMLQLSSYIAQQKSVQELFRAGKHAVTLEGGGRGLEKAAEVRKQLYDVVSPSWLKLMEKYDARQLHFHLGPGSLSFLRVHEPDKFGDRLDDIRHIVVDSYQHQEVKTGFEVGRVNAGIRGATPVWIEMADSTQPELIGVLEVGTSYQTVLEKISRMTRVELLVLVKQELIHATMWPESIKKKIFKLSDNSSCYVEAISHPRVSEIINNCERFENFRTQLRTFMLEHDGKQYAVTHFPHYDYKGTVDLSRKQAGIVIMLAEITDEITAHQRQLKINLIYAIAGFIIIELLLYLALVYGSRKLNSLIQHQTNEINQLKEFYKERSERDGLTGLYNHRCFTERLQQEMDRSVRTKSPLSLMMLDLDNFKLINDQYGHIAGDSVLQGVASMIDEVVRSSDFAGRYGGEEFIIVLTGAELNDAASIAKRLIKRIAAFVSPSLHGDSVTASVGVAQWNGGDELSSLVHQADDALYLAKQKGKNRVEKATKNPIHSA
jgi:diguanylate cyclase (GGDEF)-like protein